jgi:hypothetical protein
MKRAVSEEDTRRFGRSVPERMQNYRVSLWKGILGIALSGAIKTYSSKVANRNTLDD